MITLNTLPGYNTALDPADSTTLGMEAAREVQRFLSCRPDYRQTPLHRLDGLAGELGVAAIFLKDEGLRLGLGSFKALGGSYAVIRLVLEEAGHRLGHPQDIADLNSSQVREIARQMTFGCATDGNHGKSVAMGARMVGARAAIFVHAGVSDERVAAIAACGAEIIRVEGTYDDSVAEAARVCEQNGWSVVSDTSWPGYERIPSLVMQGYTAMLGEVLEALPQRPTHVFVQAGVGGLAAALAGHLAIVFGANRPRLIVVEPARAACIHESARTGRLVKTPHGEPTIMAMLECYEPSLVAWRILSRKADAFMTVDEDDAAATMLRLARPPAPDPAIVAGESGCAGLAGLIRAASDPEGRKMLGLDENARVLAINTETATDKGRYEAIVGMAPEAVAEIA
ncbi:diaminopropionate ammonia-lyase [Aquamicrobium sp. NLF2-7]|uniref:diaminopropionate ammonia-lyase n=1 Tax=Aquamicrobium sp. NLF2-7 TaxID=2918753 RepID=UPI001EFB50BE|nr:diaminopropionate ammonia-lyase [Aquamicrobium sp. NLF2-7]MCG8271739.1 diaminopropionate ammonia-lyase [Aquamicrobium sp. NLF2-7]